jgi:hypothetical protein
MGMTKGMVAACAAVGVLGLVTVIFGIAGAASAAQVRRQNAHTSPLILDLHFFRVVYASLVALGAKLIWDGLAGA